MTPLWYARKYGLVEDKVFNTLNTEGCLDFLYRQRAVHGRP